MAKPQYRTFVVERRCGATRSDVWQAHLARLGELGYDIDGDPAPHGVGARRRCTIGDRELIEETLSLEPPWRRVTELSGHGDAPFALCQRTLTLRDDGAECHLAWSVLVEPGPAGETDRFIATLYDAVADAADELADRSGRS